MSPSNGCGSPTHRHIPGLEYHPSLEGERVEIQVICPQADVQAAGVATAVTAGFGHRADDVTELDDFAGLQIARDRLVGESQGGRTSKSYGDDRLTSDIADEGDRPFRP